MACAVKKPLATVSVNLRWIGYKRVDNQNGGGCRC
jgi:hypothetical protein